MGEFELIRQYFSRPAPSAVLGVGDDAALLLPGRGMELVVSSDMLVAGRHFFSDVDPRTLGHKALAVNLSDLAAMGATPRWLTLSLALPQADAAWCEAFADGLYGLAARHGIELVGGDTTRGPLTISITVLGEVPRGKALRRDAARAGDDIWVSGALGAAALQVAWRQGQASLDDAEIAATRLALDLPTPRVALGEGLRGIARAAIDLSDGLLGDLGHVLQASDVGAELRLDALPVAAAVGGRMHQTVGLTCALGGGDDYELLCTAAPAKRGALEALALSVGVPLTCIGTISRQPGLTLRDASGRVLPVEPQGHDHFA